eukprot:COSAG01_NODE_68662_length_263_cov_0.951220_1_plen_48_part_00
MSAAMAASVFARMGSFIALRVKYYVWYLSNNLLGEIGREILIDQPAG